MHKLLRDYPLTTNAVAATAAVFLFAAAVYAQGQDIEPSVAQKIGYFLAICGAVAILGNVAWSFFDRKRHDKKNETISELEKALTSRKERLEEEKAINDRLRHSINDMRLRIEKVELTNEAVVSQNLQMKAILKQLRLTGKWEGNETDIFNLHDTEQ